MLAFEAATGRRLWSGDAGPQGYGAVATEGRRLYAGVGGNNYGAFSLDDGRSPWVYRKGHQRRQFMSMTVTGDAVFVPETIGGYVVRLDAADGKERWINSACEANLKHEMNNGGEFGHETFTDLAVAGGLVYGGFNDGQFIAFDAETGEKRWVFQAEKPIQSSPSVAGGLVYFGGWDGHLYALDAKTGALAWKHDLGARILSSPWPGDGVLYVGGDDGKLYAFE